MILPLVFCSCASERDGNDDELPKLTDEVGRADIIMSNSIKPDNDLSEFFKESLKYSQSAPFFSLSGSYYSDTCAVYNSEKELKEAYSGNRLLPAIDFNTYSLIIGRAFRYSIDCHVTNVSLYNELDAYRILVTMTDPDSGRDAIDASFFWGLYPKMKPKEIIVLHQSVFN